MSTIDDLSAPKNAKMYTNDLQSPNQKARDTPIKLIDFSKGFQINEEALDFLRSIKEEIIIVSVIGKARTGKSYLMNLLLDLIGKGNGFQVASSLQSCTKGIWLWGTPKNSLNGKAKIVFLDSEGTSSIDKTAPASSASTPSPRASNSPPAVWKSPSPCGWMPTKCRKW